MLRSILAIVIVFTASFQAGADEKFLSFGPVADWSFRCESCGDLALIRAGGGLVSSNKLSSSWGTFAAATIQGLVYGRAGSLEYSPDTYLALGTRLGAAFYAVEKKDALFVFSPGGALGIEIAKFPSVTVLDFVLGAYIAAAGYIFFDDERTGTFIQTGCSFGVDAYTLRTLQFAGGETDDDSGGIFRISTGLSFGVGYAW